MVQILLHGTLHATTIYQMDRLKAGGSKIWSKDDNGADEIKGAVPKCYEEQQ
ncbi:hypothetical protein TanjilG_21916 [Lupinus angustifolius]|nr:hypothetical protein TanjilG_21916 [Lupinus angustifolius]